MFEVQTYLSRDGQDAYARWLAALTDKQARACVLVRVSRMAAGNKRTQRADIAAAIERWHDWQERRTS